jgi:hypothetical protein
VSKAFAGNQVPEGLFTQKNPRTLPKKIRKIQQFFGVKKSAKIRKNPRKNPKNPKIFLRI